MHRNIGLLGLGLIWVFSASAREAPVAVYSEDDILVWIEQNTHLMRVLADDCQLNADIQVRAEKARSPSYQLLWGEMLLTGTCLTAQPKLGEFWLQRAADQGLGMAWHKLGEARLTGKWGNLAPEQAKRDLTVALMLGDVLGTLLWLTEYHEQATQNQLRLAQRNLRLGRWQNDSQRKAVMDWQDWLSLQGLSFSSPSL